MTVPALTDAFVAELLSLSTSSAQVDLLRAHSLADEAGLTGEWTIGGVTYTATDRTRFEDEDGDFAVNAQVKIEYVVQGNGRFARKIETISDDGDVSDGEYAMPHLTPLWA